MGVGGKFALAPEVACLVVEPVAPAKAAILTDLGIQYPPPHEVKDELVAVKRVEMPPNGDLSRPGMYAV
ncbi:MAG: hypothetical protein AAGG57_16745 [Pseudomonadota bacterium]